MAISWSVGLQLHGILLLLLDSAEAVPLEGNDFELMEKRKIEARKAKLDEFRMKAEKSDCWKKAVQGIETRCKNLGDDEQSYLAIAFTNCHLSKSGRRTYPCLRETQSIEECTGKMDDTTYLAYTTFFTHTANICFYVKSELWQHKTENTISKLSKTSEDVASQQEDSAKKQLQVLQKQNTSLENQQKIIQGIETRCKNLGDVEQSYLAIDFTNVHLSKSGRRTYPCLRETQSIEECTGKMDDTTYLAYTTFFTHTANICFYVKSELWQHKTENTISKLSKKSEDVASQLEDSAKKQLHVLQKQNTSLENQQKIISHEMQLSETLRNSTLNARKAFEDMKQNAVEQRALFSETFDSVFKRMDKVRTLQSMLLGEFLSLQSVAFYIAAMCTCYFLTSTPRTSGARLPLFIGLFVLIFLERLVTSWDDKQSSDSTETVHGRLWLCRKVFIMVTTVVLMVTGYKYQDCNKINCDILRELQQQIRDMKRWQEKRNGLKAITNEESLQKGSSAQSIAHLSYSNHDLPCDITDACSLIHILGNDISDDDDEESDYSFVPSDSELESFSDESSDQEDHETTPVATTPVTRRRSKGTGCKGSSFLSRTNRKIEEPQDLSPTHRYNLRSRGNGPADFNGNSLPNNLPSLCKLQELMDNLHQGSGKRYTAVIRKPKKNSSDNTALFSSDEEG